MILIGSSNVYRPWDILKDEDRQNINLQRCTKIESFRTLMAELVYEDKKVIISVVENFVCDAVKSLEKKTVEEKINETLVAFVDTVKNTATRLPETRYTIITTNKDLWCINKSLLQSDYYRGWFGGFYMFKL